MLINCDSVCVIDLDKIRLSDPAKDVSRFVRVLKKTCYEAGGDADRTDLLGRVFVDEYRKVAPGEPGQPGVLRRAVRLEGIRQGDEGRQVEERVRGAMEGLYLDDFARATSSRPPAKWHEVQIPTRKAVPCRPIWNSTATNNWG